MPPLPHRVLAALCYAGALRVPLVALFLPEWAFTIPSGLLFTALAWLYGRKRSPFLCRHGREGFRWSLQANLLLAGVALFARALFYIWLRTELALFNTLWHFSATVFRWAGLLISILTLFAMAKAVRGKLGDPLTVQAE